MATVVYQGLQSCLDSQFSEPRALRLRLSSSGPCFSQPLELALKSCFLDSHAEERSFTEEISKKSTDCLGEKRNSSHPDLGGWSFLQALSCSSPRSKDTVERESVYIHPLVKRSSSTTLSEKSLALCTEDLGNETGADVTENNILSLASCDEKSGNSLTREYKRSRQGVECRKANLIPSFPPPLTTRRGSEPLQVRPHREDGRLLIKATKAPPPHTCFKAERSNGRLRLCFLKDYPSSFDHEENKGSDQENEVNSEEEVQDTKEEEEEEEEDEDDNNEDSDAAAEKEDASSLRDGVVVGGGEMGVEKLHQRTGRCVEGEHENRELLNWETRNPFWVATS